MHNGGAAAAGFLSTKDKTVYFDGDVSRREVSSFLEICCQSGSCLSEGFITVLFPPSAPIVIRWHGT